MSIRSIKLKKGIKFFLGLTLWILGFVLMNVEQSYSATCTPEVALRNAIRSARSFTGKEELKSYTFRHHQVSLKFFDGAEAHLEVSPTTCDVLEVDVLNK